MPRRKKNKSDKKMDESWLLPYSDMLTLLLALFIVLFAMSEVDVKKFEKLSYIFQTEFSDGGNIFDESATIVPEDMATEEETEEEPPEDDTSDIDVLAAMEYEKLQATQEEVNEYITANSLEDTLGTELTGEGLLVTVRTDVTFDSGSATVKKNGREIAIEIASFLNTEPPHEIVVNGHADDRPMNNEEFASNWELSSMRAIQFMYILMDNAEIAPEWFSARGYGEFKPVKPNTSEKNRAINRRVEVLIQPNYDIEDEVESEAESDSTKSEA